MKDYKSYFLGRALFIGIGMSYIFTISGSFFWLSEIIGYIMGLIIIKRVNKFNNYKQNFKKSYKFKFYKT